MLEAVATPATEQSTVPSSAAGPGSTATTTGPVARRTRRKVLRRPGWDVRRPLRTVRVIGLVGALAMVGLGGHLAAPIGQEAPTNWLHLLGAYPQPYQRGIAGAALIIGLVLLAAAFLRLARMANDGAVTVRQVALTAALWVLPFLIGPPLMSLDVHSYVAQGAMLDRGLDPYRLGPEFIRGAAYNAVDPRWRAAHAPYGPLALLLSRVSFIAGAHSAVWAVVVMRFFAAAAVVGSGVLAVRLAANRALALTLAVASPLVLVTLVSAAHHEAVVGFFVIAAIAAQRARHEALAVVLAAAALADKLPGAVALGTLGLLHLLTATSTGARVRVLVRDGLAVAAVWVPVALLVPDALGWVRALSTPGLGHTGYAPVSLVAYCTHVPENLVRAFGEVLSVVIVGRLMLTVRRRPLEATIGWGLLAVALLGPVLYPWYLAPAALVLGTLPTGPARLLSAACGAEGLLAIWPRTPRRVAALRAAG